jgi:hypothetical protein
MKKETSKKLTLSKIRIANLNQVTSVKQAPTTTVVTSHLTVCRLCFTN